MDVGASVRDAVLRAAEELGGGSGDPRLRDGTPLSLPPLSVSARLQTKAVTAATLAANLVRENRNRLRGDGRDGDQEQPGRWSGSAGDGPALHQIVPTMSPFDAVSNDALAVQAVLRGAGYRSEIFSEHIHGSLRDRVRSLEALEAPGMSDDAAVYHVSTQAPRVVARTLARRGPLFLRHHNITPAEWFAGISLGHEASCRGAREEFAVLCGRATVAVADSPFNAEEVRARGLIDVTVVPIVLDTSLTLPPWTGGGRYAVTIGRIAPNKRIDFMLRATAAYQAAHDPDFGLVVVGTDRGLERYGAACRDLERELGMRNVRWVGSVDEAEKLRLMAAADAYLCASDHEGFCVPIVESFRLGLPVVARATTAVTGTCGDALAVDTDDPSFLADVMRVVVTDADLRTRLIAVQDEEAKRFDPEVVGAQFLAWARSHMPAEASDPSGSRPY